MSVLLFKTASFCGVLLLGTPKFVKDRIQFSLEEQANAMNPL